MDGFILLFGLFHVALIGVAAFLACLGAICHPRYRRRVRRPWKYGIWGGLIAFLAMSLFGVLVGTEPGASRSLFFFWTGLAFFAGFAGGATLEAIRK